MQPPSRESHLGRVADKCAPLIARFFRELGVGARFRLYELEEYVCRWSNVAPGSPSRVMRALRAAKALGYRLVSRSASTYEVTALAREEDDGSPTLPGIE